jgi:uncharacterized protein (TIGR00369 family)/putative nucleotidyltransferase with HDIG domain
MSSPADGELSRDAALALLEEWVQAEPLRRHCLAVEAAMRGQARRRGADEQLWGITGLLHDLDYERFPDLESGHPRMGMAELERRGYPAELVRAVASHADYMGVSRESELERSLAAVDELSGFVLACAYVRPQGFEGMAAKSVRKKLRQPSFAAAVSREDVQRGAGELGVELDELIEQVIAALAPIAPALGVRSGPFWEVMEGRAAPPPAAELLGFELVAVDPGAGTIEVRFRASEQFLNPAGSIQGGFLAAMLDDTLGPALVATLAEGEWAPTTDLHVQFLSPAAPGTITGRGRVVRRGRGIAFLAGELTDEHGTLLARAAAPTRIRAAGHTA